MVESRELARSHLKRFREFCQLSSCFSWRGAKFFSSFHKSLSLFTNHLAAYHSAPQQPPQITFTSHKSYCCLSSCSSALLDQVGMPPLDLLPPASAPLRRRPLRVGVFPSLSLPSLFFLPRNWSLLLWWSEASLGAALRRRFHCQLLCLYLFLCIVCISIFVLLLYRFLAIKYPQLLTTTKSECMQNL